MIVRIVRMTFAPNAVDRFRAHFDDVAPRIRAMPGCQHLELWQDVRDPNVCTTYSHWDGEDALDAYRDTDVFREAWAEAKSLFAARPVAHSYKVVHTEDGA